MSIASLLRTALFIGAAGAASCTLLRADDVLHRPYATLSVSTSDEEIMRRDDLASMNSTSDGVIVKPDGSLDLQAWDEMTDKACIESLSHLTRSSNPTGNCICYNLPSLDPQNGTFEAEIRLYHISEPRDAWAVVPASDVKVSVSYNGASVSTVKKDVGSGPDMTSTNSSSSSSGTPTRRTLNARQDGVPAAPPKLLQSYMLVGRIDKAKISDNISMSDLESIVLPTLTLKAKTVTGGDISTNVSLNEAAFLTGVFSKQTVQSDFAAAQVAVNKMLDALHNNTNAFILPGTQIMIFPVGAIITSVWLLVALVIYGFGTFERMQYAEMYKRRQSTVNTSKSF